MIRPVLPAAPAPALRAAVVFGIGIWAGAWSGSGELLAAALAILCGLLASRAPRFRSLGLLFFAAGGFAAGRFRIAIPAEEALRGFNRIDRSRPAECTGRIDGFWTDAENGRFTTVRLERCRQSNAEFPFAAPARLWVSGTAPLPAGRGDRASFVAAISLPDLPASTRDLPQPFIEYAVSEKSALEMRVLGKTALSWISLPDEWLAARLFGSGLPKDTVAEPVAALLLGRTAALDRGLSAEFRRGGLFHVLAISGLHVALMAGFLALVLGATGVSRRNRDLLVLLAVAGFSLAVGGRMPVARASLTIGILLISRLIEKPISPLQAIGLSALAILAADPRELWRAGFYLTYAAAAGISILAPPLAGAFRRLPPILRVPLAVGLAAQAAIAPLVLWRFNLVSPLSWLAAPLAVPIAAALLLLGGAVLFAVALHLSPAVPAIGFLAAERLLRTIAGWTAKTTFLATTPPIAAVAALALLLALAARRSAAVRSAGIAGYLVLFSYLAARAPVQSPEADFSIEGLDVGQGDAFLLRSGGSAFLIDGGGSFEASDEEFGRSRLLPKLLDRGVARLDGVLLSHPHPDHALGLFSVVRELPVGTLYVGVGQDYRDLGRRLQGAALLDSIPIRRLRPGATVAWAGGSFRVLRSGGRPFKSDPINNESVVALYEKGGRRVLFTGDAGAPAEEDLLRSPEALQRVDVLKVGHHGSRTSSTPAFLEALSPRAAILSCGRNNRFGHPAPQTLERLARLRIPVFRTDLRSDVGLSVTRDHLFLFERGVR